MGSSPTARTILKIPPAALDCFPASGQRKKRPVAEYRRITRPCSGAQTDQHRFPAQIRHGTQIHHSFCCGNVGNIGHPKAIGKRLSKCTPQQLRTEDLAAAPLASAARSARCSVFVLHGSNLCTVGPSPEHFPTEHLCFRISPEHDSTSCCSFYPTTGGAFFTVRFSGYSPDRAEETGYQLIIKVPSLLFRSYL